MDLSFLCYAVGVAEEELKNRHFLVEVAVSLSELYSLAPVKVMNCYRYLQQGHFKHESTFLE